MAVNCARSSGSEMLPASSVNSRLTAADTCSFSSTIPPGMPHCPTSLRLIATICNLRLSVGCHRVTTGSAAWLHPHLPSSPRSAMPVRPRGLSGLFCSSKRNSPSYETRVFQSSGPSPLISGSAHPPGFVTRLFSITPGAVYAIGA